MNSIPRGWHSGVLFIHFSIFQRQMFQCSNRSIFWFKFCLDLKIVWYQAVNGVTDYQNKLSKISKNIFNRILQTYIGTILKGSSTS